MEERLHSLQEEVRIIKQNSLGDDNDECNGRGVMIMTVVVVLMVTVMVIVIVMMLVVMVMMMTDPSGLQEFFYVNCVSQITANLLGQRACHK